MGTIKQGERDPSWWSDKDDWDESLEAKLRREWERLRADQTFDEEKEKVRKGWEYARS